MSIVCTILQLYIFVVLARVVLSWFPASGAGPLTSIQRILHALTEPIMGPLRSILPPLRMGGMGLDLSPIALIILLQVLLVYLCR